MKKRNFWLVVSLVGMVLSMQVAPLGATEAHASDKIVLAETPAKEDLSRLTRRERFHRGVGKFCERTLIGFKKRFPEKLQQPILGLGNVIPVRPFFKTLSSSDKSFFVFIESPLIGLLTTPASSIIANVLSQAITGQPWAFDGRFLRDTAEVYLSYQGANVFRNGIAIDQSLTSSARSWLNWWLSASIYAATTAGDKIATAHTPAEKMHAGALVAYAMAWPLFSQRMGTMVFTPLLFSKFPKESLLTKIQNPSIPTAELVEAQQKTVAGLKEKLESAPKETHDEKIAYAKIKDDLESAEYSLKWIGFYRRTDSKSTEWNPESIPWSTRKAEYWSIKTGASMGTAIGMVSIYFLARWALVGKSKDDEGIMKKMIKFFMAQAGVVAELSEDMLNKAVKEINDTLREFKGDEVFVPAFYP